MGVTFGFLRLPHVYLLTYHYRACTPELSLSNLPSLSPNSTLKFAHSSSMLFSVHPPYIPTYSVLRLVVISMLLLLPSLVLYFFPSLSLFLSLKQPQIAYIIYILQERTQSPCSHPPIHPHTHIEERPTLHVADWWGSRAVRQRFCGSFPLPTTSPYSLFFSLSFTHITLPLLALVPIISTSFFPSSTTFTFSTPFYLIYITVCSTLSTTFIAFIHLLHLYSRLHTTMYYCVYDCLFSLISFINSILHLIHNLLYLKCYTSPPRPSI